MEQKLTDIMKQAFQREQETILATGERMDPEAFERAVYALAECSCTVRKQATENKR